MRDNNLYNKLIINNLNHGLQNHRFLGRRGWPTLLIASHSRSLFDAVSATEEALPPGTGLRDRRSGMEAIDRTGLGWRVTEEARSE